MPTTPDDEVALTADIIEFARQYGRYGYRRITALLRASGRTVNKKRVERIWRREGLKVPAKQPKRGRLWLNDGSCIRLRPERPNHVWSYDFVADRTHDGKAFRMLCIIDEFTREAIAIRVARKLKSTEVIEALCDLFASRSTSVLTTAQSSLPWRSGNGLRPLVLRPLTSNQAVPGKMGTARASTASFGTSCSMVRSSTR
jgi:transposase InsO family protein